MGCLGFGNVPIADGKPASLEVDVAESMRLLLPPGSTQPRAFHGQDVEAWSNIGKKSKNKFQTTKFEELEVVWAFLLGVATVMCWRGPNVGRKRLN
jgi:hypothetical protein